MRTFLLRLAALAVVASCLGAGELPYRFLLVTGDQWVDDTSTLITPPGDFQLLAALLKTWGLPFDVLRLDQQVLDRYHMLDRDGRPRHGVILWDADPALLASKDLGLVEELVAQGVGFVILGDSVAAPELASLAGLRYLSEYKSNDAVRFLKEHFVTRGLTARGKELLAGSGYSLGGAKVTPDGATLLAARGTQPFLAVREPPGGGRVVWLGLDRSSAAQLQNQLVRDLLKRCLVWSQGYALYAEYARAIILFMDDMGTSDKTALSYWHYRTPTEEEIRKGLIEPLKRRKAVMDMNVNTGYADRKSQRILEPWRQRVVDEIDGKTIHDFASTKRGLDAGVAEGVFDIQSHGWTHMLPDLDSPPGPWWTAPMDGVGSLDWYNEFGDGLRKREVPAATQKLHMALSLECIRRDFGRVPAVVRPGGGLYSKSYANDTARIAAQMGFGLATWNWAVFLSPELVISLEGVSRRGAWDYDRRVTGADIPWTIDAPYWLGFHDRDLALDNGSIERLLSDLGDGVHYMSGGEYSAYLHAKVERAKDAQPALTVNYDPHYCRHFTTHPSTWTLHLSDETRRALKTTAPEKRTIQLPAGKGRHQIPL